MPETDQQSDLSNERIEIISSGADVPKDRRGVLLESINEIISTNWRSTEPFWSRQHSPFKRDYGLVFLYRHAHIIGYFIYRRLSLDGIPVFYGAGTAILRNEHGSGAYQRLLRRALVSEWSFLGSGVREVYFAWRTRNPSIWLACARMCRSVAPAICGRKANASLEEICARVAQQLFPEIPVERPGMVMRDVFSNLRELDAKKRVTSPVGRHFSRVLANAADAIFSVGIIEKSRILAAVRSPVFRRRSAAADGNEGRGSPHAQY